MSRNWRWAGPVAVLTASVATAAAQEAKPGAWEFTGPSLAVTACVTPDRPVPFRLFGDCAVDRMTRKGGTVTWSATCRSADGTLARAEGKAVYDGDNATLDLTLNANGGGGLSAVEQHATTGSGSVTTRMEQHSGGGQTTLTIRQHITGRYIGACG